MDYILKSSDERVVINDFVQGDPLSEENLDRTLELVSNLRKADSENPCKMGVSEVENADKIRLLYPNKTIWIYSGYNFDDLFRDATNYGRFTKNCGCYYEKKCDDWKRRKIIKQCDVMVDGKYIDEQRDITLKWKGSSNQRVIDIKKSLQKGEIVLWEE